MIPFFCETDTLEDGRICKHQCRQCEHEVDTANADPAPSEFLREEA